MKTSVDFYRHVSLQIKVLSFFGLWFYIPYEVNSIWFWIGLLIRILVGTFTFLISTSAQIIYVFRAITSGNFNLGEDTDVLSLIVTEFMSEVKLLDMRLRRDKLSKLLDLLNSEEFQCRSQAQRDICEKAIRVSRWLFLALAFCASMDIFVHVIVVPSMDRFETLPLKMNFIFFDVNDPRYFNYVFAYQILYKPCMLMSYLVLQTLPWALMSFTVSQLDVLIYNFENMKELVKSTQVERNCDENEAFRLTFRELVLHHASIIRFINVLQEAFGGQLSTYLLSVAVILGSGALQFFSIEFPSNNIVDVVWLLAYLNLFIGMLFGDCYFGNAITTKCEQLSNYVFACPWTNLNNDLKKNILIFLAKTQKPVVLTAAKLVPISLETFTTVMNWTYKGFAVINQMK